MFKKKIKKIDYSKFKILIVEDDEMLSSVLALGLKKEGFDITVVGDGPEALKAVAEEKPHLILLDILLPGMNGFEVLEKIKDPEKSNEFPVIFLTNMDQDEDKDRGFRLGAYDYLVKANFTIEEILKRIEKYFNENNFDEK